jgi:hypothetical protein
VNNRCASNRIACGLEPFSLLPDSRQSAAWA